MSFMAFSALEILSFATRKTGLSGMKTPTMMAKPAKAHWQAKASLKAMGVKSIIREKTIEMAIICPTVYQTRLVMISILKGQRTLGLQ